MEITIDKDRTRDITFDKETRYNREIVKTMSMAVELIDSHYRGLYRELHQQENESQNPIRYSVLGFASSENGVDFTRSTNIALSPTLVGKNRDRLAVEDPTIVTVDGVKYVFYSAVEPKRNNEDGVLVSIGMVKGQTVDALNQNNRKIILTPEKVGGQLNRKVDMVKEPEFIKTKDGKWLMIYEYGSGGVSRIGMAESKTLTGNYENHRELINPREGKWDNQHVSPGPIIRTSRGDLLMFYNGRGPKNEQDQTPTWAIGSVIIDLSTGGLLQRSEDPIILPPEEIGPDGQLIAFANSVVEEKHMLYYTAADKRMIVASYVANNL
jgi:predicted GH43/DUF377 family glycosyl hydrolase